MDGIILSGVETKGRTTLLGDTTLSEAKEDGARLEERRKIVTDARSEAKFLYRNRTKAKRRLDIIVRNMACELGGHGYAPHIYT